MLEHSARVVLVSGGVRGGKSLTTSKEILAWLPHADLIWVVGPNYELTRPEMIYLARDVAKLEWADPDQIRISQNPYHPCSITTKWGCEITAKTAAETARLAGRPPDAMFIVEAGQQPEDIVHVATERLSERRGRLFLSGTLEDSSYRWYADLFSEGQTWPNEFDIKSFSLPTWENEAIYPGGLDNPEIQRIKAATPPRRWLERYAGQPVPPDTLVFPEFNYNTHVSSEASLRDDGWVDILIDPGEGRGEPGREVSLYVVEAVQWVGGMAHVIDEVRGSRMRTTQIVNECRSREWWPYVKSGVIDIAAKRKQMGGPIAAVEEWRELSGIDFSMNYVKIEDGIWRLKTFLWDGELDGPRLLINPACERLIWEFNHYQYPQDKEGRTVREKPVDRYNDAIKALYYGLVARFGYVDHQLREGAAREPARRKVKYGWRNRRTRR